MSARNLSRDDRDTPGTPRTSIPDPQSRPNGATFSRAGGRSPRYRRLCLLRQGRLPWHLREGPVQATCPVRPRPSSRGRRGGRAVCRVVARVGVCWGQGRSVLRRCWVWQADGWIGTGQAAAEQREGFREPFEARKGVVSGVAREAGGASAIRSPARTTKTATGIVRSGCARGRRGREKGEGGRGRRGRPWGSSETDSL